MSEFDLDPQTQGASGFGWEAHLRQPVQPGVDGIVQMSSPGCTTYSDPTCPTYSCAWTCPGFSCGWGAQAC
jgi:hypothetical protein